MEDKDFEKYLYFSSDKVECCDIEKHKLFEIDNEDFYEVDLSLKQKVVCMLVTTRNQQYFFECKQDAPSTNQSAPFTKTKKPAVSTISE